MTKSEKIPRCPACGSSDLMLWKGCIPHFFECQSCGKLFNQRLTAEITANKEKRD